MDGRVREATHQELDRVAALWTLITHHHAHLDPVFEMRSDADGELGELIRAMARDPDTTILVYDEGGDLPGMCILRVDQSPPIMREVERAEITDLGVRPEARRRGVGRALVQEALRIVRALGVARVEVQVARGNEEGQAFWRSLGFGDLMDVLHKRL